MFALTKRGNQSSRSQIQLEKVRDGILVLPGKKYRLIMEVSSVNFELKSEDEQDALIDTYQAFLNSLSTPLQIVIRVRELQMDTYLKSLTTMQEREEQPVYKNQIENYKKFVSGLVSENRILTRKFYFVIPYDKKATKDFKLIKEQLNQTADIVTKALGRMGIKSRNLNSVEALNLFYSFYDPEAARTQPLSDSTLALFNGAIV